MDFTSTDTPSSVAQLKWGQQRRLEFIDFRLRWDGHLNRKALTEFFGISTPQASLDLAKYIELAPDNLLYDRGSKMYLASPNFQRVFSSSQSSTYLDQMLANARQETNTLGFVGWQPPTATVPIPGRRVDESVLAKVVNAIRDRQDIFVRYQSISSSTGTGRWLSPHALAHDGFRWHIRAYCHLREGFRDFLVARTLTVEDVRSLTKSADFDTAWSNVVSLILVPHPELSNGARTVVEEDYGMLRGEATVECRQALLFYLLRHLNLLPGSPKIEAHAQQILLKNSAEIYALLE